MQPILNHLDNIVRPAVRDYVAAESALDAAHIAKDANAIDAARKNVMRRARIATTELHHLQDFVLHNPQSGLSFARIEDIRSALRAACVFGRGTVAVGDTDPGHGRRIQAPLDDASEFSGFGSRSDHLDQQRLRRDAIRRTKMERHRAGYRYLQERPQIFAFVHHPKQLRRLDEGAQPAGTADGTILSADSITGSAPKSPAPFSDELLTLPRHRRRWRTLPFEPPDPALPQVLDEIGTECREAGSASVAD